MTDVFTDEKRSEVMASIKSEDTEPELKVRRYLHGLGCRFRVHCKELPGKPDIVFTKPKLVIFIHGCFWHMHGCENANIPDSNQDYWLPKLKGNAKRDEENVKKIEKDGWAVKTIWECEIKIILKIPWIP